jgi:hypothetical protein
VLKGGESNIVVLQLKQMSLPDPSQRNFPDQALDHESWELIGVHFMKALCEPF